MSEGSDYWAMGGYAVFVWPAYGLSAAVMIALVVSAFGSLKGREKALQALRRRRDRGAEGETS